MISIHDPIHGTIEVSPSEIRLVDSRPFQRLRHIKQTGFAELAFPGATHTRYAHSLGAMQMATRMVERVLRPFELSESERTRLRQTVRLAVLFHDLGHPPLSHASERVMPKVARLNLHPAWVGAGGVGDERDRQATHEDYTVKLLTDSELTQQVDQQFGALGVTGPRLAALVAGVPAPGDDQAFTVAGADLLPLLHQIVSSEMDADRMDYLRRDAYYSGVSYGNFDHLWLTGNLAAVEQAGKWVMALQHKAVWAFENFLLARYHMFLAVYYHHTPICFDHLLGRFFQSGEYELPADVERYLDTDDIQLWVALRQSENRWAQHVVRRRAYRLLLETHDYGDPTSAAEDAALDARLYEAGVDFFRTRSRGVLSKYLKEGLQAFPLMVIEQERGRVSRIEDYTPLYRRFADVAGVARVYCHPEHLERARTVLGNKVGGDKPGTAVGGLP